MKLNKMLSILLAMVLSTSTLTGCANVNTVTNLPLNNIQNLDKESENNSLDENVELKDETNSESNDEIKKAEEAKN